MTGQDTPQPDRHTAAQLDARAQTLEAAYIRATRHLVALAELIGDPIPEELADEARQ